MAVRVPQYLRQKKPTMNETEQEEMTSEATGVSISSVQRFKKEVKEGRLHSIPSKRKRTAPVMDSLD